MKKLYVAVLLTVFNRKEVTLKGLASLFASIKKLPNHYLFDIYMTDDGCSDGTPEAVAIDYPNVKILKGNGNLYWGGGMNKAWNAALNSNIHYDYFLWFNDDVILFEDALCILFRHITEGYIITGAFHDMEGVVSYGGKKKGGFLIEPNGSLQEVDLMNGNLVVISREVCDKLGIIDKRLIHGGGDYEYGLRAKSNGIGVYLAENYVGICNRHDAKIPKYCSKELTIHQRLKTLNSPIYNPYTHFYYNKMAHGILRACVNFAICYMGALLPSVYSFFKRVSTQIRAQNRCL